MTTTSTTSESPKKGPLLKGARLHVSDFSKSEKKEIVLEVIEHLTIDQIGTSYKVYFPNWPKNTKSKPFFLKIPEPVEPSHRDGLRDRFLREMQRGKELNDLATTIASLKKKNGEISFHLPQLRQAGLIQAVGEKTDHEYCALPYILYDWKDGVQLDKLIKEGRAKGNRNSLTKLRAKWFDFAKGLTQVVGRLHNHGFLHAYIVPRNILIKHEDDSFECTLAGFGYSSLSIEESSEPQKELAKDKPFQAPEFSSRRPLDALWHPADIYSVGAVLLYLATCDYPEVKYITSGQPSWFPENVEDLKVAVRSKLMSARRHIKHSGVKQILENDNIAKIIDNCLRHNPDDRIATAEELFEAIEVAGTQPIRRFKAKNNGSRKPTLGPFFSFVLDQREKEFNEFAERLKSRHHFELYGSRTKIIEGLCRMLGGLDKGAVYRTTSLPSYWTSKNLGPDGRFLAMNKHVARLGVRIERIFLVSGPYHTLSDEEQRILQRQAAAMNELLEAGCRNFQVKVYIVDQKTIQGFERSGKAVAFVAWQKEFLNKTDSSKIPVGQFLCLNFISRGDEVQRYGKRVIEREIKKVRIWDPGRGDVYGDKLKVELRSFNDYWKQGSTLNLDRYIEEGSILTLDQLLSKGR